MVLKLGGGRREDRDDMIVRWNSTVFNGFLCCQFNILRKIQGMFEVFFEVNFFLA